MLMSTSNCGLIVAVSLINSGTNVQDLVGIEANPSILIGVGRFRILGGQGLEFWGGQGGAKFPAGT